MGTPINRVSDPRWERLGEYVRDLADRMGLSRFYFEVSHDAPDIDGTGPCSFAYCKVYYLYGEQEFRLHFSDQFFQNTPERQRNSVVHELVHVCSRERDRVVDSVESWPEVSASRWEAFAGQLRYGNESVTDLMAGLIAPRFPLPDLGDGSEVTGE